jgi:PEGA domain
VKSDKPFAARPDQSAKERATAPSFSTAGSSDEPGITLPEAAKTENDEWERSMLGALDAWARADSPASSPTANPQQLNSTAPNGSATPGKSPAGRALNRVDNLQDDAGSGVNLDAVKPEEPVKNRPRAVLQLQRRERQEDRAVSRETKHAKLDPVEPRLPTFSVASPVVEPPKASALFPTEVAPVPKENLEGVVPLPAARAAKPKRQKDWVGVLSRRLAIAALVLLGVAEVVVIAWTLVGRSSAGPSGSLTITSSPPGAQVVVDGVVRGSTPATMTVPVGTHAVEVRSNGPTQVMAVRVDKGGELSRYFDLPAGTAPSVVRVETKPADAKVMIDGTFRGRSPVVVTGLNPGRHIVRVEHGLQSREREVVLAPGGTVAVSMPIEPLPRPTQGHGWLAIWTPVELQASENGKTVGSSRAGPWQLPAGRHNLELSNPMLGIHITKTVDVIAGRSVSMDAGVPSGLVSIASSPTAEIRVDGDTIGESPIVNRPLTIGQHDVVARHPEMGERRVSVTIMPGTTLSLNLDLRR